VEDLIRPPGSPAEEEFLARCTKCSQCMRVCPTNVLQPALLQGGLEGLWTPYLNNRIGSSGCQLNCVACSQTCPTGAIRPITLDEKLGRGPYASAGPIRLGLAVVDRARCWPWAFDKPCIVCQEVCPVSPKAIVLKEQFVAVFPRNGAESLRLGVKKADAAGVELESPVLRAGQFGTGDYYCTAPGPQGPVRRRILGNTAGALTLAPDTAAAAPPAPGGCVVIEVRLQQPVVDRDLCIGCGICQHECPATGRGAVYVISENETRRH
jgi:ferredoxin